MKKFNIRLLGLGLGLLTMTSCLDDLNTDPKVELTLEQILQKDPNAITGMLSKAYASFALSGPNGPESSDISDDPGESPFLRGIINLQDFTADDMKNRWDDNGLVQLTTTTNWTATNKFFRYLYNRVYFVVPQCNNLLSVLKSVDVPNKEQVKSEVRFLRSLAYYYMIDCFGKGVLLTEDYKEVSIPKNQSSRKELFDFVESELKDIENSLPDTNTYGRANKAVAQMLLAKLYLNAKVYTDTDRYADAATYLKKIIASNQYQLADNFVKLFSGDNGTNGAEKEIIYPLIADSMLSQSYGNTTYIINGSMNGKTMNISEFGAAEGWEGHRATKAWYSLYGDLNESTDDRAKLFWKDGHNYEMNDYKEWTDGYPSTKFRNTHFYGSSITTKFSSTNFPLFRLADVYLMYAECAVRGAAGTDMATALTYVNAIRKRAKADEVNSLTLDFILDERARELNLEGHRRTDLIRFGKFTGGAYLWPWKGGSKNGTAIPEYYNLFPIPLTAMQANPNLTQNPGY